MKKILFSLFLLPSLCYANYVNGTGEFYYGPDTDENTACEYAFNRAKQDAIQNHLGIEIESFTNENCESEKKCSIDVDTYTQMFGTIKQIVGKRINKYEDYGRKVCEVTISAVVERIENKTNFLVEGKLKYSQNEELDFYVTSNVVGYVSVYNYYDLSYTKLYSIHLKDINTKYKIRKSSERIVAQLPVNSQQSKELLVFIFSEEKPQEKKKYNSFEFSTMLSSLNSSVKRIVFRYVTIGKKL